VKKQVRGRGLLQVIEGCLREGGSIDIDGLGSFQLDPNDEVVFEPNERRRIFLAYAKEDAAKVRKLYAALQQAGFEPWMDEQKLLPGQNWPRAIERAIELSDFFAGCFSRRSIAKRGHFQSELAYALDLAKRVPEEEIFFIPVRLDACEVPRSIARTVQYVDLFPDWERGVHTLSKAIGRRKPR
jgi:hypothetical protein